METQEKNKNGKDLKLWPGFVVFESPMIYHVNFYFWLDTFQNYPNEIDQV